MRVVIWIICLLSTLTTYGQTIYNSEVARYSVEFPGKYGERKTEKSTEVLYEDKEKGLLYFTISSKTDRKRVKKKELEAYAKSKLQVGSPATLVDTFNLVKLGGKYAGRGSVKSVNERFSTFYKFDFIVHKYHEIIVGIISQKDNIKWTDLDVFSSSFKFK